MISLWLLFKKFNFDLLIENLSLSDKIVRCNYAMKDSDVCIKVSPNWGMRYDCEDAKDYCKSQGWSKDAKRCCPESCRQSEPFTSIKCHKMTGVSCEYPFYALSDECGEGTSFH